MSATASSISQGLPGGDSAVLGIYNAQVIKPAPGILVRLIVVAPGTLGTFTINDSATLAGASAANVIFSCDVSALAQGQNFELKCPCDFGIVVSSVPSGSQFSISYS